MDREPRPDDVACLEWLEGISLAALALDEGGRVAYGNAELARLLGLPVAELRGTPWFERFVPPEAREVLVDLHRAAMRDGTYPADTESEVVTVDGARRLLRWRSVVLRDADGRPFRLASIGDDVTRPRPSRWRARSPGEAPGAGR
jgi:PAS domain S-box-containing protein